MPFRIPLAQSPTAYNVLFVPMGVTFPDTDRIVALPGVIVDTGASVTTVSPTLLDLLAAAGHPPIRYLPGTTTTVVATGPVLSQRAVIPRLRVGDAFELTDWTVQVLPCGGVLGLLGGDILSLMERVTLSYDRNDMYLEGELLPGTAIRTA